ncbi:MAG: hypothetical protein J6B32_02225 [Spirochaetaceae bacterium]|nr:hypothetical protein [Spirochaetaceae bacterium]
MKKFQCHMQLRLDCGGKSSSAICNPRPWWRIYNRNYVVISNPCGNKKKRFAKRDVA